jgi:hypothetical protein
MNIDMNLALTITIAILAASLIKHVFIVGLSYLRSNPAVANPNHIGSANGSIGSKG